MRKTIGAVGQRVEPDGHLFPVEQAVTVGVDIRHNKTEHPVLIGVGEADRQRVTGPGHRCHLHPTARPVAALQGINLPGNRKKGVCGPPGRGGKGLDFRERGRVKRIGPRPAFVPVGESVGIGIASRGQTGGVKHRLPHIALLVVVAIKGPCGDGIKRPRGDKAQRNKTCGPNGLVWVGHDLKGYALDGRMFMPGDRLFHRIRSH